MHLAGLGVVGAGGAVLLWAVVRGLTGTPSKTAWHVGSWQNSGGPGVAFGTRF